MADTHTDCRDEVGITVGLIDGVISIMRILVTRDLSDPEVKEALQDLRDDEDFAIFVANINATQLIPE